MVQKIVELYYNDSIKISAAKEMSYEHRQYKYQQLGAHTERLSGNRTAAGTETV